MLRSLKKIFFGPSDNSHLHLAEAENKAITQQIVTF
jgi:hypothetical protein